MAARVTARELSRILSHNDKPIAHGYHGTNSLDRFHEQARAFKNQRDSLLDNTQFTINTPAHNRRRYDKRTVDTVASYLRSGYLISKANRIHMTSTFQMINDVIFNYQIRLNYDDEHYFDAFKTGRQCASGLLNYHISKNWTSAYKFCRAYNGCMMRVNMLTGKVRLLTLYDLKRFTMKTIEAMKKAER